MARAAAPKGTYNFTGGIITEASAANFPENAALEIVNIETGANGVASRRIPIKQDASITTATVSEAARRVKQKVYKWENVGEDPDKVITVIQNDDVLYFVDYNTDTLINSISISSKYTAGHSDKTTRLSFTAIKGWLISAAEHVETLLFKYNGSTVTLSSEVLPQVRDFDGDEADTNAVDENPTTLSNPHKYNLLNQAWDDSKISSYFTSAGEYPNNAEIWHAGKDSDNAFSVTQIRQIDFGASEAPRGRYVYDYNNINRSSIVAGATDETFTERMCCVTAYASRIFYAANPSDKGATLYYSQLVRREEDIAKCYQLNDPTAEWLNELLDTDGGDIPLPEVDNIVAMRQLGNDLLLFANNGVWALSGPSGFTATDFSINKLSDVGTFYPETIISTAGLIFYWGTSGINVIERDQPAANLSKDSIQSLFNSFSTNTLESCRGVADDLGQKAIWLYREYDASYSGTKALVFDARTASFFQHSFGDNNLAIELFDAVPLSLAPTPIVSNADTRPAAANHMYTKLYAYNNGTIKVGTFNYNNSDYKDWGITTPEAKIVTAPDTLGDPLRKKMATYLVAQFVRTEDSFYEVEPDVYDLNNQSSLKARAAWDWTNTDNYGTWSNEQQLYRLRRLYTPSSASDPFDYGKYVVETKTKLRGKGKAMSLVLTSDGDKHFILLGYSVLYTIAANP